MDPKDGAVVALVGGFDFFQSKFNRVTQARHQPGSGFKPFVYAAAFDKGYTPASVVVDAPIVIDSAGNDEGWRPKEMEGEFYGPVRLRDALAHSRNLVSVRLVREIGVELRAASYVTALRLRQAARSRRSDHGARHGGAQSCCRWRPAYSTFANGGFRVTPYYVDRILDAGVRRCIRQSRSSRVPSAAVPAIRLCPRRSPKPQRPRPPALPRPAPPATLSSTRACATANR